MPDLSMKILVVDDFVTMRRIVRNILRQIGFSNIEDAGDGHAALGLLREKKFDFIVSDWSMPNMTGIDFLRAVRADEHLQDIPFLMVTAEAKKENIVEALSAGVSDYIVKPFTAETVREKVDKIFPA